MPESRMSIAHGVATNNHCHALSIHPNMWPVSRILWQLISVFSPRLKSKGYLRLTPVTQHSNEGLNFSPERVAVFSRQTILAESIMLPILNVYQSCSVRHAWSAVMVGTMSQLRHKKVCVGSSMIGEDGGSAYQLADYVPFGGIWSDVCLLESRNKRGYSPWRCS